jgi:hypothetical protein
VFASIDVHNNTGLNPYYSVVCHPDNRSLHLAVQFARTVTWFRGVHGSQTGAFAPFCPAVALECGKPGIAANAEFTAAFLETALNLSEIPDTPVPRHDIDLYHTVATVTIPAEVEFGFGTTDLDLNFDADFDHMNFREWPTGTVFARTSRHRALLARDESGVNISDQLFERRDGCVRLTRPLIPAMITLDQRVVRQDCLCYLMVRVPEQLASRANERPLP